MPGQYMQLVADLEMEHTPIDVGGRNSRKRCLRDGILWPCPSILAAQALEHLGKGHDAMILWGEAYPVDVFAEPSEDDFKKAAAALKAQGLTLDAISASNFRHVLKGAVEISREALRLVGT